MSQANRGGRPQRTLDPTDWHTRGTLPVGIPSGSSTQAPAVWSSRRSVSSKAYSRGSAGTAARIAVEGERLLRRVDETAIGGILINPCLQRQHLVGAHQPRIAGHIGGEKFLPKLLLSSKKACATKLAFRRRRTHASPIIPRTSRSWVGRSISAHSEDMHYALRSAKLVSAEGGAVAGSGWAGSGVLSPSPRASYHTPRWRCQYPQKSTLGLLRIAKATTRST
jgi:hypothetical protein